MATALTEEQLKQGDVLARAHSLLLANPKMTIGEAIRRAIEASDVPVPGSIRDVMVVALARLLLRGFPSKVDA